MDHIETLFVEYTEVVQKFGREKLEERLKTLLTVTHDFINEMGYNDCVAVNEYSLLTMMLDYFADILRLKQFHKINYISELKIIAYETYWLLRRRPLQVLKNEKEIIYINETFAVSRIIQCLSDGESKTIFEFSEDKLQFFTETLFYFLKYRQFDAQALELIMLSFCAGRIYSEELKNTSKALHPKTEGQALENQLSIL